MMVTTVADGLRAVLTVVAVAVRVAYAALAVLVLAALIAVGCGAVRWVLGVLG